MNSDLRKWIKIVEGDVVPFRAKRASQTPHPDDDPTQLSGRWWQKDDPHDRVPRHLVYRNHIHVQPTANGWTVLRGLKKLQTFASEIEAHDYVAEMEDDDDE